MKLIVHGGTDIGRVRRENQDAYLVAPDLGYFAVADGVGGLPGGAEAAQAAIRELERIVRRLPPGAELGFNGAFEAVNSAVVESGRAIGHPYGTGTTLTACQIIGPRLRFGHVGDSSLHRFRRGRVEQVTLDHTVASDTPYRFLLTKDQRASAAIRNVLTRCIGTKDLPLVDTGEIDLQPGDWALLSSDGAFKGLEPAELATWLDDSADPAAVVARLLQTVNQRGGYDNATVILMRADPPA